MYDERFARQYRYEPPPEFPLASPCSGIVHHLSGPNKYALTQIFRKRTIGRWCLPSCEGIPTSAPRGRLYFHYASGFATQILAYVLDSLVRVSRRVNENHFVSVANMHLLGPYPVRRVGHRKALRSDTLTTQRQG